MVRGGLHGSWCGVVQALRKRSTLSTTSQSEITHQGLHATIGTMHCLHSAESWPPQEEGFLTMGDDDFGDFGAPAAAAEGFGDFGDFGDSATADSAEGFGDFGGHCVPFVLVGAL